MSKNADNFSVFAGIIKSSAGVKIYGGLAEKYTLRGASWHILSLS